MGFHNRRYFLGPKNSFWGSESRGGRGTEVTAAVAVVAVTVAAGVAAGVAASGGDQIRVVEAGRTDLQVWRQAGRRT